MTLRRSEDAFVDRLFAGAVSLGAYETSSALKKAGAVSGLDMTTEAAVAKLYYLFSCGYDKEKIKQAMEEDLRGEISVP